uniref:AMP-dependent synthetase/ligase domain-containing protein n=1 Tax=Strigamia maritima TaxID=126957 RepID=T1J500_STRMM
MNSITKSKVYALHRHLSTSFTRFYWAGQPNAVCEVSKKYKDRVAIKDSNGDHTYDFLSQQSEKLSKIILDCLASKNITKGQTRVAHLCPNDASYVVAQWAIWKSGNVSLPLHFSHPSSLVKYYIEDSKSSIILSTSDMVSKFEEVSGVDVINVDVNSLAQTPNNPAPYKVLAPTLPALILYTSGTTGPPKGVVLTHGNISAMIDNMVEAWKWTKSDVILHTLPLHHTHGLINALLCPLRVGATVEMMPKFDPEQVWEKLTTNKSDSKGVNIYMAVPTMYAKLLKEYDNKYASGRITKAFIKATCEQNIRLMISGSASLPDTVFEKWKEATGHELLERYGMTEIGMALTNPLQGQRKPGFVGNPFSTVQVRISKANVYSTYGVDVIADGNAHRTKVTPGCEKEEGELLIKGPSVFKEYWGKPEATASTFTKDGWFKTGDTAKFSEGAYKILGRTSVDIIKSGGYKLSALDIERHLLTHPSIEDCSVVGVDDEIWGQKVAAVVVLKEKQNLDLASLKVWCKERMAPYSIPAVLRIVEKIPRNTMGKINKKELIKSL